MPSNHYYGFIPRTSRLNCIQTSQLITLLTVSLPGKSFPIGLLFCCCTTQNRPYRNLEKGQPWRVVKNFMGFELDLVGHRGY